MFRNVTLIPPGTGMPHQINLESLSRVVSEEGNLLFPDSVVGTDSHMTMVNGLGVLGWGKYGECVPFLWAGVLDPEALASVRQQQK